MGNKEAAMEKNFWNDEEMRRRKMGGMAPGGVPPMGEPVRPAMPAMQGQAMPPMGQAMQPMGQALPGMPAGPVAMGPVPGLVTVDGLLRGSDAARPMMPDRETVRAGLSPMNRLRTSEGEVGRDTFKRRLAERIMGDAMRPFDTARQDWAADRGAIRQGMVEQFKQPGMVLKPGEAGMMGGVMFDGPPPVLEPPKPNFMTARPGETVLQDGRPVFAAPPVVEPPKPVYNLVGPEQTLTRDGEEVFSRKPPAMPEVPVQVLKNDRGEPYAEQVWDGKAGVWVTRPLSTETKNVMTGAVVNDVSMVPEKYRDPEPQEAQALLTAVREELAKTGQPVTPEALAAESKRQWRKRFGLRD
jgi:hypothetical protein